MISKLDSRHICRRRAIIGCSPRNVTSSVEAGGVDRVGRSRRRASSTADALAPARRNVSRSTAPTRHARRPDGNTRDGAGERAASERRRTAPPARRDRRVDALPAAERDVEVDDRRVGRRWRRRRAAASTRRRARSAIVVARRARPPRGPCGRGGCSSATHRLVPADQRLDAHVVADRGSCSSGGSAPRAASGTASCVGRTGRRRRGSASAAAGRRRAASIVVGRGRVAGIGEVEPSSRAHRGGDLGAAIGRRVGWSKRRWRTLRAMPATPGSAAGWPSISRSSAARSTVVGPASPATAARAAASSRAITTGTCSARRCWATKIRSSASSSSGDGSRLGHAVVGRAARSRRSPNHGGRPSRSTSSERR